MKKILLTLCMPLMLQALTPQQARQLRQEFQQVGIYNPQNPDQYDASRADQIISALEKGGFRRRAQELKLAQARSLQQYQPETGGISEREQTLRNEIAQLQQENQQLRTQLDEQQERTSQLEQQVQQLRQNSTVIHELVNQLITEHNKINLGIGEIEDDITEPLNLERAQNEIEQAGQTFDAMRELQNNLQRLTTQ